jgi:hypothetical protein
MLKDVINCFFLKKKHRLEIKKKKRGMKKRKHYSNEYCYMGRDTANKKTLL